MLPHQKTSSCSPQLFLLLLRCQWVLIQNAFFVLLLLLLSCFVSNSVQSHRRQPNRLPVPGILQARTLEWVAISFSNAWKWKVKVKSLSRVRLLATPWTAAYQAPPSMGFARQEYWSGLPWLPVIAVSFTKPRYQQSCPSPEVVRKSPFLASFSFNGCQNPLACGHITPTADSVLRLSSPPLCQMSSSCLL